MAIIVFRNRI